MLSTEPYKGTRDFYPIKDITFNRDPGEVNILLYRQYIFDVWRKTLSNLNFLEYDASLIEQAELYIAKSGEDLGKNQLYSFFDKKNRNIALRPEMTPTLARMVVNKFNSLRFPLRWFSIPNCFRYEKPQRGRTREHWQLNVDFLGQIPKGLAEIEILNTVLKITENFGAKKEFFQIKLNSKEILDKWLEINNLANFRERLYPILDDWLKIDNQEKQQLLSFLNKETSQKIFDLCDKKNTSWDIYIDLITKNEDLKLITNFLDNVWSGINYQFLPYIIRGQVYYTGLVFEVFDNNPNNPRSLFGGGRYDNLLEIFEKPNFNEKLPAIGYGMGDLTWLNFLQNWNLLDNFSLFEEWKNHYLPAKVGFIPQNEQEVIDIYKNKIPTIISNNQTFEIDYNFTKNYKKRQESLYKRGCTNIDK